MEDRKNTIVYCNNYGEAGALEYYSDKYPLPRVICPHNNYWYWWPEKIKLSTVIIIGGNLKDHLNSLEQVEAAGGHKSKYAMPYENNLTIFVGRGLKRTNPEIKQRVKNFN